MDGWMKQPKFIWPLASSREANKYVVVTTAHTEFRWDRGNLEKNPICKALNGSLNYK